MNRFLFFITFLVSIIIVSCEPKVGSNYQKKGITALRNKSDTAMYLIYKLNIEQFTNKKIIKDTLFSIDLLGYNLFKNKKYLNDTLKFSFLFVDKNGGIINLHTDYFVNCIGFVRDSIKFIEINDGGFIEIENMNILFRDTSFMYFANRNKNYLSEDLKKIIN